jgi:adenylyltransferase/sulfurtransferase
MISDNELLRYDRHVKLSVIGLEGQEKLKQAKVLVIGTGGLGCPVLQYLTSSGVGTIGVMDADKVSLSNLQRQVLFTTADIGELKTNSAINRLEKSNPLIKVNNIPFNLTTENALATIGDYDVVVDCTDNFPSRYLINDACVLLGKPFVYGALHKFNGQLSVFNYNDGPTYRCLYPDIPKQDEVPNCSEVGVLGVLPSLIGTLQATEVIKIILEIGEVLSGKILTYDVLSNQQNIISFSKSEVMVKELLDYNLKCAIPLKEEITSKQLKEWLADGIKFNLIDIREEYEREDYKLDDTHFIPMANVLSSLDKIDTSIPTIFYCESGNKSKAIVSVLKQKKYTKVYSLIGGLIQWKIEI